MKLSISFLLTLCLCVFIVAQDSPRVLTWSPDKPFADSFITDGASVRVVRDNGLTIAVVGYDAKDHVACAVAIINDSERRVNVLPEQFFFSYKDKSGKDLFLSPLPGKELAKKYAGRARWGNFFRAFAAGMATSSSTVSTTGNIYDNQGHLGTYESNSTIRSSDPTAQRNAAEANQRASANASTKGSAVLNAELLANTLFPKQYVQGSVYFKRKKMESGLLFVVIDGTAYAFRFGEIK